jgi:hypothetical protein
MPQLSLSTNKQNNITLSTSGVLVVGDGEINTASNLGTGDGVFSSKLGSDLRFKSLKGGTNITLSSTTDEITVNSTGGTTNLSYTASPTNGIVNSNTGTNATIPLADGTNAGLLSPADKTKLDNTSGTNTGDQNLFSTIAVAGQDNVIAETTSDTLNLVAGTNITITTDQTTDSITINSTGGGSGTINASSVSFVPTGNVASSDVQSAIQELDSEKQIALVSGTNIKTINSNSLLGSGDIIVEPTITAGTTGQYWRGDKSWQTLDKTAVGLGNVDNTSDTNKPISTATQTALNLKADLVGGTVPANQLPSFVDDVLEYADLSSFPITGESGKIYVALDTNLTYRWTGSVYAVLNPSLALGETSTTAYRGDRGKTAYDHSQTTGNPHGTTKSDIGLGNVVNADTTTTANITDSSNKRFITDAQQTVLGNTSNTNTGDETNSTIKTKLGSASTSADGYLTSTDWNNFNSSSKYYVSRWGADITDTTGASLQTALNNMVNAGLHTAILDAGTWYTDQTITLKLSLYGLGKDTSIIRANNGLNDDVILVEGFTGGKGSYRTYKDFGVFGNAQYNTTGSCIKVSSPTIANFQADFLIFDSLFLESPKDHGIEIADPNNIIIAPRIVNCDIIGDPVHTIGDGIVLQSNTYDAFVHNCDIGYFKVGSGIRLEDGRGDQISNCKSWQNLYGYNLISSNRTQIVNCLSDYSGAHGLRISGCNDNLLFTNCTFRKSSANNNNLFESIAIFVSNDIQFYNCACFGDDGSDPTFPNNPSFVWFIASGCSNIKAKGMRYANHISGYANVGTVANLDIYDQGQVKVNSLGNIELAGALQPVSLADASAPNNSSYFSSTTSRFTYKNSSGDVSSFSNVNSGDQNLFSTIAVSGQSNVVADSTSDTLTLVAGSNMTITTNATTDTITLASSGGSSATQLNQVFTALGSSYIYNVHETYPWTFSANISLADGTAYFMALGIVPAGNINTINYVLLTTGVFTEDNFNGFALYTYSGGTLTRVAISTDQTANFKASTGLKTASLTSTYTHAGGLLYVAHLYNHSAQTTAASIAKTTDGSFPYNSSFDFTNSAKLACQIVTQTTLSASYTMSSLSNNSFAYFWCALS